MPPSTDTTAARTDWLGMECPFPQPVPCAVAGREAPADPTISLLLDPSGATCETEPTEVRIWRDDHALHIRARCITAAIDRVRELAGRKTTYARDAWGDDALEVQIDVGRTQREYRHLILPPNGIPVTYVGYNNRHVQGWHPRFEFRVRLEKDAWSVDATLPFDCLGATPGDEAVWGLNIMRVNAGETRGYVQWAATFGDALRPELFGELRFSGAPGARPPEVAAYATRAAERQVYFLDQINALREPDALCALGVESWQAWAEHMAHRTDPISLRWEGVTPGEAGIPESERKLILAEADALVERIEGWSTEAPDEAAFGIASLEVLGDAWLLTTDAKYVSAFDAALRVHAALMHDILTSVSGPDERHHSTNPYHDIQVVNTTIAAHAYINLSRAGLSPQAHAAMMWTVLRAGRFATHNIRTAYTAGNHQVYESGGLAALAALFPEMPESNTWATAASRSIRLHFEREVYPDGGYFERCGYHSVALSFAMHAVATVLANGAQERFAELMSPATQATMQRMHEWLLWMNAPDGTFPAFGDCGESSHLCFLQRGAAIYQRGDLAWPLRQLEPDMVPPSVAPREPAHRSITLDSQFTVMRDGWTAESFYMAVDHGPLGGQHSHPDTLGFVAYAHGRPVALDSGIGTTYEDSRYVGWFRKLRAHNTIVVDDLETEKVAEQTAWRPGTDIDVLAMRSDGNRHALGVIHHRVIHFIKGVGWLIHDRLEAQDDRALTGRAIDWVLHTPYPLQPDGPGRLTAAVDDLGLLVVAANAAGLEAPHLALKPSAVPVTELRTMRLWDAGRRRGRELTRDITELSWRHKPVTGRMCEFAMLLLPYRGQQPNASIEQTAAGWRVGLDDDRTITVPDRE